MDAREIFLDELKKLGAVGLAVTGLRLGLGAAKTLGPQVAAGAGMEAASRITQPKGAQQGTTGTVNAR